MPQRPTLPKCLNGDVAAKDAKSSNFYAPLNIKEGQNIYGQRDTREPFNNVLDKTTAANKTPQNNDLISVEQSVYNIVEELPIAEGTVGQNNNDGEPVYNVLEDPNFEYEEGLGQYGAFSTAEGPIYNSLEEDSYEANCNAQFPDEPVYNVLEKDTCPTTSAVDKYGQEPVYNILEGPEQ